MHNAHIMNYDLKFATDEEKNEIYSQEKSVVSSIEHGSDGDFFHLKMWYHCIIQSHGLLLAFSLIVK